MKILTAFIALVLISNAMIFIALTLFRRERPDLRARLFSWALHTGTRRRSNGHQHSSLPV